MKLIKQALAQSVLEVPPLWLMRQAGRYLPEYREIRAAHPSFLDLCYSSDAACEVTLQPIRRYGFDAAILFSDILVVPDALGVDVQFKKGEGPVLSLLSDDEETLKGEIETLRQHQDGAMAHLTPVCETVSKLVQALPDETALIGFSGAPWTVLLYMMEERPSKSSERARALFYRAPDLFDQLITILVDTTAEYLINQVSAGAEVLQIFDSWAAHVPPAMFDAAVKGPLLRLCEKVKAVHPEVPIILFPRGANQTDLVDMAHGAKGLFEGLSLDYSADMAWACEHLQPHVCIQGNLDPAVLLSTPEKVTEEVHKLLDITMQRPGFIFNLGHGIVPQTPPENVAALVKAVRTWAHAKRKKTA